MKKKSQKLIEELKSLRHFQEGMNRCLHRLWRRMRDENLDVVRLNNAHGKFHDSISEVDTIYEEQIGKAIVRET